MKRVKLEGLKDPITEEVITSDVDGKKKDLTVVDLARMLVVNSKIQSMGDVDEGIKVLKACKEAGENLELEDSTYDWLKRTADAQAAQIMRFAARPFMDALVKTV